MDAELRHEVQLKNWIFSAHVTFGIPVTTETVNESVRSISPLGILFLFMVCIGIGTEPKISYPMKRAKARVAGFKLRLRP